MSDAFADLWNSSAPSKPAAPKTLGGSVATPQARATDAFSLLSSRSSSSNTLPNTPLNAPSKPAAVSQPKAPASNGSDAFGDLLGGSMPANTSTSRMTMAERAAQAERQRLAALQRKQQTAQVDASPWQGLDSLAGSTFTSSKPPAVDDNDDDWGFGSLTQAKSAETKPPLTHGAWGLNTSTVKTTSGSQTVTSAQSRTLWDLDDLLTTDTSPTRDDSTTGHIRLGSQNDALLGHSGEDESDILGDLGKPVDALPRSSQIETDMDMLSQGNSRPVSPPPHILGQIVEMGFSVQQARIALAATDTGLDVQAALETLLSNGAASSSHSSTPRHQSPAPSLPGGHRDRMREHIRSSSLQRDHDKNQTDKLIAQASEIGLSVLNKASLFWREGKERVQKAYEERASGSGLVGSSKRAVGNASGRPKWMTEEPGEEHDKRTGQTVYKDSANDHDNAARPKPISNNPQQSAQSGPQASSIRTSVEQHATNTAEGNLLSPDDTATATVYVSPWRRGKPKSYTESLQSGSKTVSGTGTPRVPSPIRAVPRASVVSASQSAISLSTQHKDRGTEKFKLGQYSEAEVAYSSAVAALPELHLLLVPLYNNRALTRLKTGDYAGTVEDTTAVLGIIGSGYHPAREIKVSRPDEGAAVDLADGLVKALKRRAEALEGREKWEEAGKDWEALAAKEWAKSMVRNEAVRGAGRCRRMVQAVSSSSTVQPANGGLSQQPKRRPLTKPAVSLAPQIPTQSSVALLKLRSANDAAEAEEQTRHELKDSVDAKILAWKAGKEANIRALLASLDIVLWPELGLQKVGMAELVSTAQVKIRYTKTIAKLHPDKLNPTNSTVEQRMFANGVFGALNDAWNAFKQ